MSEAIPVAVIAAVAENGVIGSRGGMPWRLSTDMKRFRRLTMGKPVVMGRRTYETIGKPLDGRANFVVTRQKSFAPAGTNVAPSLEAALLAAKERARATGASEIMVIGGGELYRAALPLADRLYITHVEATPEGDTHFPAIDPAVWHAVNSERQPVGEKDTAGTVFVTYERI